MDILSLWLPILLSAVIVFVASSIMHMVLGHHKSDYKGVPGEEHVMAELRKHSPATGTYMFPHTADMKDWTSPEYLAKYKQGPVGMLTILEAGDAPTMGKALTHWFIYCLIVSIFTAYLCSPLGAGAHYGLIFRWAGTAAILGYAISNIPDSIWKGQSWSVTFKFMFDGVVYGLLTAGTFGWLWPE